MEPIIIFDEDDPLSIQPEIHVLSNTVMPKLIPGPNKGKAKRGIEITAPETGMATPESELIAPGKCIATPQSETIAPTKGVTTPRSETIAPRKDLAPRSEILTKMLSSPKIEPLSLLENALRKHFPGSSRAGLKAKVDPIENQFKEQPDISPLLFSTPTFLLHPIVFNSGMVTVPSLNASIMNGQLVTSGVNTLTFEAPELAIQNDGNIDFLTDPEKVTTLLKNLSHQDVSKVYIFKTMNDTTITNENNKMVSNTDEQIDCTEPSICSVGEARSLETMDVIRESIRRDREKYEEENRVRLGESGAMEQRAQLSGDRIDWEDKIPMDVISFVVS